MQVRCEVCLCAFQINWDKTGEELHNFIRGNDKVPGAWATINGEVGPLSLVGDDCHRPESVGH